MLSGFFPFAFACNLIFTIPFSIATAVPYPTTFANSTRITFPSAAGTTGCPSDCTISDGQLGSITWTGKFITATITAETIIYVVNKKTNTTRTETITNTEVDLKGYTPLPSTKTTSVVLQFGTINKTEILTFPSILYTDYPSSYTFCGTLPTTTAGVTTCLKHPCAKVPGEYDPFNSDSPVFAYPSHPPVSDTVQNISASYLALDPKGSTWDAVWSYDGDVDSMLKPLIPDLGVWNCTPYPMWPAAAIALNTALYLTATSTSTEAGDEAGATPAAKASPPKEVTAPAAGKEPAKVEPQAAEASQLLANPFGVRKPAAVAENPTPAASPPAAAEKESSNAGTSSNQAANDSKAASNPPAANSPSSQEESSNKAAPLPIPGLTNEATTAVPAAAADAVAKVVISSTNAQGSLVVATSQVPGVIVTSTNAQGSQVVTTIPVVSAQALDETLNPTPVVTNGHTLTTTTPPAITIGTQTITANAQGKYVVGSQTLTPGGEIVVGGTTAPGGTAAVGGTTVSLAPSGTEAVVGTSTEGLGAYIVGGLGTGPNGTGGVVTFLGDAEGRRGRGLGWMVGLVVGVVAAMVVWS